MIPARVLIAPFAFLSIDKSRSRTKDLQMARVDIHQSQIQELFSEIMALAIRLRQGGIYEPNELPPGEQQVLEILVQKGDHTVPQIARSRGTSRQNIQILVNRLQASQCVNLVSNPSHKRSSLVQATEKGATLLRTARRARENSLALLASVIPEREVLSTTSTLKRIRQSFKSPEMPDDNPTRPVEKKKRTPRIEPPAVPDEAFDYQLPVNLL